MEKQLRDLLNRELIRRHGYGMMSNKIKPVHIANALLREEHGQVGRMTDLKALFTATMTKLSSEEREDALRKMLERDRERWGRLADEVDLRRSTLSTKVLPLLRTLLGVDGAAYGRSPGLSSFSSPTGLTATRDPSDEHAGAFVHQLWSAFGHAERLALLDRLQKITDPERNAEEVDDLTALLVPLVEEMKPWRRRSTAEDSSPRVLTETEMELRKCACLLERYEARMRANPIASLQRIVLLASLSVFFHAARLGCEYAERPRRSLLIDVSGQVSSSVAGASTRTVSLLLEDSRAYMRAVIADLLRARTPKWEEDPGRALAIIMAAAGAGEDARLRRFREDLEYVDHTDEILELILDAAAGKGGRGLDGYLRLLGLRAGLLYPMQKNPNKRCVPTDRALEVLAVSAHDFGSGPLEYRDFLDVLYERWGLIVGGRAGDARLLADLGCPVPTQELRQNSERLLSRLVTMGLARRLADSVAVVGLMEGQDD